MNKYGLVMAEDFFGESTLIMTEVDNFTDFIGTHFYKCVDADADIAELIRERDKYKAITILNTMGYGDNDAEWANKY